MLTAEQINSIHRLHWAEHGSVRKIARHLHLGRRTISQYLVTPARSAARRQRASKLDPFKATIAELLEQDAKASAMEIAQRLRPLGFTGGLSILKDYLHAVRTESAAKRAYVRMEPGPGERFEIDWGHFGALLYQGHATRVTRASSMPSVWSNVTAASCLWSSRTARASRLSYVVISTLSSFWAGSHPNSGTTISQLPLPNTTATWCGFIPAFCPSPANTVSCHALAMWGRPGKFYTAPHWSHVEIVCCWLPFKSALTDRQISITEGAVG